ncbi:MAG: transcriptional repressor [Clostridia bacterium]|nr:transcriptional repressor [Clostridia bacterium]
MKRAFTGLRKEILNIIETSQNPISAKVIQGKLSLKPDTSTIYRALKFLQEKELIVSLNTSKNIQYFYSANKPYSHFILCNECSKIEPFYDCVAFHVQEKIEREYEYKILDHFFYFIGVCKDCQNKQ